MPPNNLQEVFEADVARLRQTYRTGARGRSEKSALLVPPGLRDVGCIFRKGISCPSSGTMNREFRC